jgi:hypothetical protein
LQRTDDDAAILDDVLQNPDGNGQVQQQATPDPFAARHEELTRQWASKDQSDPAGYIGDLTATLAADRSAIDDLLAAAPTEQSVGDLAARIAAYDENRKKAAEQAEALAARAALIERLKAVTLPSEADLSGEQKQRLATLTDLVTKLADVPDAKALADADAALKGLGGLIDAIKGEIGRRNAAGDIKAKAAAIKDPADSDMNAAQKDRLTKQREPITSLAETPDADAISKADAALAGLGSLIEGINQEIGRRKAAEDIKAKAAAIQNPAGSDMNAAQKERLTKQREPITSLAEIPEADALSKADAALTGLSGVIADISDEIGRRKAAETIKAKAAAIKDPAGSDMSAAQKERLTKQREPITALAEIPEADAISKAEAALTGLGSVIDGIEEEIGRRKAAEELKAKAAAIQDPPASDTDPAQKDRLTKQREPITSLAEIPDAKAISDADAALKALTGLVDTINGEIARRKTAVKVKADAGAMADPPATDTDTDQKDRLTKQRAPILALMADPDASQLKAAEDALAGLQPLITTIEAEVVLAKQLAVAKAKVLADLAKTLPSPGATKAEITELVALRDATHKALTFKAPQVRIEQANIDAATAELKKVTDRIAALPAIIAARQVTNGKIAVTRKTLEATRKTVPSGLAATLAADFKVITDDAAKGAVVKDFTDVDAKVAALDATMTLAVAFGNRQRRLMALMPMAVANGADQTKLTAALATADSEAAKPDFAAASAALDGFEAETMGGSTAGQADQFLVALAAFRSSAEAALIGRFKRLPTAKFPNLEDFKATLANLIKAVTTAPFATTMADGILALTALKARLTAFEPVADAFDTMIAMTKNPATPEKNAAKAWIGNAGGVTDWQAQIDAHILAMTTAGVAAPPPAAVQDPNKVAYDRKKSSLSQKVNALKTPATAPGATYLDGLYTAAQVPARVPTLNYVAATGLLTNLEPLIVIIRDYRAALAAFNLAKATLDATLADSILAAVKAEADADHWPQALAAMPAAVAAAKAAAAFVARRAEIDLLSKTSKDVAQKKTIDDALATAAGLAAGPGFKFGEATAALDELSCTDGVMALETDVTAYSRLLAEAEAQCVAMTKAFTTGGAAVTGKQLVEANLAKAKTLFDPDGKHADAVKALNAVIASAQEAERAALERRAAVAGKTALDAVPARPMGSAAAVTDNEKAQDALAAALAAANAKAAGELADADSELAGGTFDAARKGYEEYRKTLNAAAKQAAKYLDLEDHGHSIDAHGPAATHAVADDTDPQVIRVRTGQRPDGQIFHSKLGSTFESEVDWVAARQMGLERVQKAYTDAGRVPADGDKAGLVIEHGRPIDRCIAGQRGDMVIDEEGELGEGKTASTFEVWKGLTRTNSGFIFVQATGKWKLHYQYPHADGWDNDTKTYTTAVPEFKLT